MPRVFIRKGSGHTLVIDTRVQNVELMMKVIGDLQHEVAKSTIPIMRRYANMVAADALFKTNTSHPRNLFRGINKRPLTPKFTVEQVGDFYYRVRSANGKAGKSQALAEFAEVGYTKQGAALTRALNDVYGRRGGRGSGRVLWQVYDEYENSLMNEITSAVNQAAATIESRTS